MKREFSKSWISSKQPRKQRKYRANAPNHLKRKLLSVNLDKTLRQKYNKRNLIVRKGDEVKIMRGSFKGKQGKVGEIDLKNSRVQVEGAQRTKKGGEKLLTWFQASNLKIIQLNLNDSKRLGNSKEEIKTKQEVTSEKDKKETVKKK